MKKMFEYDLVRRMYYHENLSRREISRRTGYHRKTVNKMLRYSQPRGYQRAEPAQKPKIGPFTGIIDEMLETDRRMPRKQRHTAKRIFLPLPPAPFEACRMESRQVTSLSLVQFQNNHYSVPIRYAYRDVILKAFVDRVVICWKNETIACHQRSYAKHDYIFDPLHYLPLLERKPGALDGGLPFSGWELPGGFDLLRRLLESRNGPAGTREYIQVLQLLRDFKLSEVSRALDQAFRYRCLNFEAIKMLVLSGRDSSIEFIRLSGERLERLPRIRIASSDTSQYRMLLAGGAS